MAKIDPGQERRRLSEFYAGQMDGELEKVASQAYDLTEIAREVLRAELTKRGLAPDLIEKAPLIVNKPVEPQPGDPPPEPPEEELLPEEGELTSRRMVTLRRFRDLPDALLAKGSLDSAGIQCALADDNVIRMDWFYSNAIGGIKLLVDSEEAAEAEQVLTQPIPENFDVSGVGQYAQPRCPKCGSLDINFQELDPAAYLSLAISVPIPFHRRAWRCRSCRAEWEDEGAPDQSESTT
jgi:hypothetical protein